MSGTTGTIDYGTVWNVRFETEQGLGVDGGCFARESLRILNELRNQYVIGYYADPVRGDGSWRPVKVDAARPGIRLRARTGYYDLPAG